MRTIPLVLLGFGNVGQSLARLLLRKAGEVSRRYDAALRVVGIGTGGHGMALDQAGLDLNRALEIAEAGGDLSQLSSQSPPADGFELLRQSAAEALLESIPVNYQSGQPALDYLEHALQLGMHAVTANKGPVVHGYQQLCGLARSQQRRFRFESSVMDGAPVFSLWRNSLPASALLSFRGILNSTTNYILTRMEAGDSLQTAVAGAQAIGVAETDPSGDLEGWDAAIKVAALVNVLMDYPLSIEAVDRQGIEQLGVEEIRQAQAEGKRWKLICSAERLRIARAAERAAEAPDSRQGQSAPSSRGPVNARVAPELIGPEDPLYSVTGSSSAITFVSDVLGDLTLIERDPGPDTTAYGMLADLMDAFDLS